MNTRSRSSYVGIAIGLVLSLSAMCAAQDDLFPFTEPTVRPVDFERWLSATFSTDAPEVRGLRQLYADFRQQWSDAIAEYRHGIDRYSTALNRWREGGHEGPAPTIDVSVRVGFLRWSFERIALEDWLEGEFERVLHDVPDARQAWKDMLAMCRRRVILPIFKSLKLPLPDLVTMLADLHIDTSDPARARMVADYCSVLDQAIVMAQRPYFEAYASRASAILETRPEVAVSMVQTAGQKMSQTVYSVYRVNLTFADIFIAQLDGADQRAFEHAWIAAWIPEVAVETPVDIAVARLRELASERDDRFIPLLDPIAAAYERRMHELNRQLIALNPPSRQIRMLRSEVQDEMQQRVIKWKQMVRDEPFAVFPDAASGIHAARLELVTTTCRELWAICDGADVPADVQMLLSVFVES